MGLFVQAQAVAASAHTRPAVAQAPPLGAANLVAAAATPSAGLASAPIQVGSFGIPLPQSGQMPASFAEPAAPSGSMAADKSTAGGSVGVLGASLQALSLTPGQAGSSGDLGSASLSNGPRSYIDIQRQPAPATQQAGFSGGLMGATNNGPQRGGGGFGQSGQPQHPAYEHPPGQAFAGSQPAHPSAAVSGLPGSSPKIGSKVFVGGLSWETSDQKLRQYFENYGEVLEAFVSYDKNTGRPRGFGFVVFAEPHIADKVVSLQHTIDRREVEAKKAVPRQDMTRAQANTNTADHSKIKKIFVGGLAPTVDEKAFREYFENFGPVEDAVVMYDPHSSRPRGFGFVTFESLESVELVFTRGVMQELHEKQIEIKRAVPREEMAPPRRSRPVHHNGAMYPPPNRGMMGGYGQQLPKQNIYGQPGLHMPPPPPQQAIWGPQAGYDYMVGPASQQQGSAGMPQNRFMPDQDSVNMYSSLTAGLAAASSMGFSNDLGTFLKTSGNSLPPSIDLGADPKMNLALDAAIGSLSGSAGAGGVGNPIGAYADTSRLPDVSADNSTPSLSSSFSVPSGYGLGFGSNAFQGSI